MTRKPIAMIAALSSLFAAAVLAADAPQGTQSPAPATAKVEATQAVYPAAILPFEERGSGVKDMGGKVADILFASLAVNPNLILVDRAEMDKLLQEAELNLTGMVSPDKANKVGELTGAKILITGSVFDAGGTLFLVAKVIGTETSRVFGDSVKGSQKEDLATLGEKLAAKVSGIITEKGDQLVAKPSNRKTALPRSKPNSATPSVRCSPSRSPSVTSARRPSIRRPRPNSGTWPRNSALTYSIPRSTTKRPTWSSAAKASASSPCVAATW